MKTKETATFRFAFYSSVKKDECYQKMTAILKSDGWLDESGTRVVQLTSCHSDNNGECEVILVDEVGVDALAESADDLFDTLVANEDVKYVKVLMSKAVEKIVINNIDKYGESQTISIPQISNGDEVIVYVAYNR